MDIEGLTDSEVYSRVSRGEVNSVENAVSRTYLDIITKNTFTIFNLIIFSLGALLVFFEEYTSAMSATGIIVMNLLIATTQEIRAKRRLDKIALLMRPKVAVIRNGNETEIDQSKIVKDDIIHLRSGDQALVDGILVNVRSLEVDESLLTGESNTVRKRVNDTVYSGSYCITGEGHYRVAAFGNKTFAANMLASAKKFDNKKTPLQLETGAITKLLMVLALIYLSVLILMNVVLGGSIDAPSTLMMAAVILDMVPIGLFLMIVLAYMIAAVRMSNSGVLLQRSNSIESISHVDTVCMDKTGTITTNRLVFKEMIPYVNAEAAEHYTKLFISATGSPNKTIDAILNRYGKTDVTMIDEIMFSSERKYSGVRIVDNEKEISLFMGAYEPLMKKIDDPKDLKDVVKNYSSAGLRTVILAKAEGTEFYVNNKAVIPPLELIAAIAIEDEVRPDCREVIDEFMKRGIEVRILSGDDPAAVNALFTIAGIPGERNIISGDELERMSDNEKTRRILDTNIFGRMRPDQKEYVIEELKRSGRYVAMVGDGVNDVKSLKEAQVGIALQSGSGAARGVADMVLISDDFSAIPKALTEGNRTVSAMRDILKIYISRNFVIAMLVFLVAIFFGAPPLLPVTNAFYAFVSLSIASFFIVIWAKPSKLEGSVLPDALKFAIPTAITISLFGFLLYGMFYGAELYWQLVSPDQLDIFGWGGSPNPEAEIVARNALLVFLMATGFIQLLMIMPYYRSFSTDGRRYDDIKPTILVFLLFGLLALAYWGFSNYPELAKVLSVFVLPLYLYIPILLMVLAWFFTNMFILRRGILEKTTNFTEWMYSLHLKSVRKKRDQ